MKRRWACAFMFATVSAFAQTAPPNDQARFLAGLPMAGSPLFFTSQQHGWAEHAVAFDKAWAKLEKRQLQPITTWMGERFATQVGSTEPLLYFFSGPDFLYAHTFFPRASTYVLCGIEPIGPMPDVVKIPPAQLEAALDCLQKSLSSVLQFSFFITKEMKSDLQATALSGTLPVLYTFLARAGCQLDEVQPVALASDGTLTPGAGKHAGVKIVFHSAGQQPQTLYYFSIDLSDGAVDASGLLKWCDGLGPARGFLKAASYLLHGSYFSKTRQHLLSQCDFVLQDDSGIPVKYFEPKAWRISTYGSYLGPLPIFKEYQPQSQLTALYAERGSLGLPFSFGYRWNPAESTLLAITRLAP